ncbi:MAG: 30S ribosomal protein S3ae, partial [Nanoarchaeota archaeon]|nr:30S ribosomal protein S3ae [Nanoarchaeota archaeon]
MVKQELLQWYEIVTPDVFGGRVIGQTTANDPAKLIGRVIEISLMELSGEATRYYIKLFFKTKSLIGSKLTTTFFGHDCTKDFIARVVQLRTARIDTNTIVNMKDAKIRIKAIAITNRCVKKGTERDLR